MNFFQGIQQKTPGGILFTKSLKSIIILIDSKIDIRAWATAYPFLVAIFQTVIL